MSGMRVTLKDVAARAGVSVTTASQGLRGEGRVAATTRIRIQQAAQALGYRPDPLLARLAARRFKSGTSTSASIVYVTRNVPAWYGRRDEYIRGASVHAEALGHSLERLLVRELPRRLQREVTGILIGHGIEAADLDGLDLSQHAVVVVGQWGEGLPFTRVRGSAFDAVRLCLEHLRRRGCRRLGLLLPERDQRDADRLELIAAAAVLPAPEERLQPFLCSGACDPSALQHWLQREQPDGLLFWRVEEYQAVPSTWRHLPMLGLDVDEHDPRYRGLGGCKQRQWPCGMRALELVLDMNRYDAQGGPPWQRETLLIPPRWIEPHWR